MLPATSQWREQLPKRFKSRLPGNLNRCPLPVTWEEIDIIWNRRSHESSWSHHNLTIHIISIQYIHNTTIIMDLAMQVGAVVGTSALLFIMTKPDPGYVDEFSDPLKLKGAFKYSHHHRQKLKHSISLRSSSLLSDDSSSSGSSVRSDSSQRSFWRCQGILGTPYSTVHFMNTMRYEIHEVSPSYEQHVYVS